MTLIKIGDSLLDGGEDAGQGGSNLSTLYNLGVLQLPSEPFPSLGPGLPYSNRKASDGLVLGELVAQELGNTDPLILRSTILTADVESQNIVYAISGSTSADLRSQVALFNDDFNISEPDDDNNIDVLLNGGNNDILAYLDPDQKLSALLEVLSTPDDDDDEDLQDNISDQVTDNISLVLDDLENSADRIVLLGIPPVEESPFAYQIYNSLTQYESGIRDFLTGLVEDINNEFDELMENDDDDDKKQNLLFLDGVDIFDEGLDKWKSSVEDDGRTPITQTDFITDFLESPGSTNINDYAFVDLVHPTQSFAGHLANIIAEEINSELINFGIA